ncbi:DUF938 domain-containing protein [Pontixanthobacter aestiaquae]|uniref:DUF938 domain-containing protein n=1 Tax=Pontixanthobacter aestiaquae TaxID=1509367 RepID=A0A844ZB77_9SPHN|nr:DUF938 domain-containing protein [Pontixanthobacter aestiaquae]MDN3645907.1 DUF938 domain-containing protein [Pontixanthobacter aestiaquae]MXO83099.1 DUF938 domain-containing protein [Pontixanthobacter aestiaquae]
MKRHAPATLRNREAIAAVLAGELPEAGTVLEVASGSGEHAVYFAQQFPDLVWQPSDYEDEALASISAWSDEAQLTNILPPIQIDAASNWTIASCVAILCCNMIHISQWAATVGLFRNAGSILSKGGALITYGPYIEEDVPTAQSNLDFDGSLKARCPGWGLRRIADLDELAEKHGLKRTARHSMPANNLLLAYRK